MKNRIKALILLLVGAGILLYIIKITKIDLTVVYSIKYPAYIVLALLFVMLTRIGVALRLKTLLRSIGKPRPFEDAIKIDFISRFLYYVSPFKLNVPAKAILLNKKSNISLRESAALVSFEYALDTVLSVVLGIAGVLFLFKNTSLTSITYIVSFVVLLFAIFISMPDRILEAIDKKFNQIRHARLQKTLSRISSSIIAMRGTWINILFNRQMYPVLFITIIAEIISGYSSKFIFLSMGYDVPLIPIILVVAAAGVAGGVSNIPGGLGVMEAAMVLLFTNLDVPKDISIAFVLIYRLSTLAPILTGYIFSLRLGSDYIKIK